MIFADKLITLRKKAGWSQEELAEKLGVTRQSVSKWEGAQSVPDIDKILQLARLFGVTTDYLLKEEQGEPEYTTEDDTPALHRVTLTQAGDYLKKARANAPRMALATALCVLSPVSLLALCALSEYNLLGISENFAAGLGLCILLCSSLAGGRLCLTLRTLCRLFCSTLFRQALAHRIFCAALGTEQHCLRDLCAAGLADQQVLVLPDLFPIAADLFLAGGDGAEEFLELRLCVAAVQLCVLLAHVQIRRIDEALFI